MKNTLNSHLPIKFNFNLFWKLLLSFMFFTVIGTLAHEFGHYIVAKYYGVGAEINYMSTRYYSTPLKNHSTAKEFFWMTLGGPLQTMLTGTIGLLLLYINRKSLYLADTLSRLQWLFIFLALFWLRQSFNFVHWVADGIFRNHWSALSDEHRIASMLFLPNWLISSSTGLIGLIVLFVVVFKFIPLKQRFTFLLAGLIGGLTGFVVWFGFVGKIIMP